MRKLLTLCALVAVAVPTAALAAKRAPGDGTLQIRNGSGTISIDARGSVIGRCGRCDVIVVDPSPDDGAAVVFGADVERAITDTVTRYRNITPREDMRFRIIGGKYKLIVRGTGINLSVVGRGRVFIEGTALGDDGEYSFDGADFASLPDERTRFQLGAPVGTPAVVGG